MPVNKQVLSRFPNELFVETGSYIGDGIHTALNAGFKEVWSIEIFQPYVQHCCKRFATDPRVTIIEGDSGKILGNVIAHATVPITFWLDGHAYDQGHGDEESPLLKELAAIATHPIKTHTILIDDMHDWTKERVGFGDQELRDAMLAINPRYQFSYEDGGGGHNHILIGEVK